MMSADKRSSNRVPLDTKVHLEFEKFSGFVSEFSHNISEGGMFIKTPNPLPIGSIVSFEFKLKDSFQLIQGLGEVTWIRSNALSTDEPAGMGIRFREISDRSRDLVKAIVTQTKSQGDKPFNIDDHPDAVTSTISADQAAQVYGSDPLNHPFQSVPSSHDIDESHNNADSAIDRIDAHLIDDTVSNPHVQDSKENTPVDPALATQTSIYDTAKKDHLFNIDLSEDDPSTVPDGSLDEHTHASMEEPMLSDQLSDRFELSLDEEMNDPDFDQHQKQSAADTTKKNSPRIGLSIFLSLLICSVLASAYLLKEIYMPHLGQIPWLSQWIEPEQDTLSENEPNNPLAQVPTRNDNQINPAQEEPDGDTSAETLSTTPAEQVEEKIQDLTSDITSSESINNEKTPDTIDVAPQAIDEPVKTPIATTNDQKRQDTTVPPASQLSQGSQKPSNSGENQLAGPIATNDNSALMRIKNLTWTVDKDDWVLIIETDQTIHQDAIQHSSLRNGPARELLILKGLQKDFGSQTIAVGQPGVHRIRTGYHANQTPPQLHIVVDLLDADIQMKRIQALGSIAKIYFGKPIPASTN